MSKETKVLYILSTGRSGTQWIANLYNEHENIIGSHEQIQDDQVLHGITGATELQKYDAQQDVQMALDKIENSDKEYFVESNCRLRYHSLILKNMGCADILGWVRDGRKVANSYFHRPNHFSEWHWSMKAVPVLFDGGYPEWKNLPKFEKCCWLWRDTNKILLKSDCPIVKIEKFNESYEYVREKVNDRWEQFSIDKHIWEDYRNDPDHEGNNSDLTDDQRETFWNICEDVMGELGYE